MKLHLPRTSILYKNNRHPTPDNWEWAVIMLCDLIWPLPQVIDPENPFACSDAVRISLLQFACLLLEQASAHIHDANNKKQGNKLRRLMTFAWPCLLGKNYVDPATR